MEASHHSEVRQVQTATTPRVWREKHPECFSHVQLTNKVSHQSSVQVRTLLQPALRTHSFSSREVSLPSTRAWSAVQLSVMPFRSAFLLSSSLSTFWNNRNHYHCTLLPITRETDFHLHRKQISQMIFTWEKSNQVESPSVYIHAL